MINWGITQGSNSFQNALTQNLQIGSMLRQRKQQDEAAKAESAGKNALAGYATGDEEQFGAAVQYNPQAALGIRGDMQAQEAAAQKQERDQLPLVSRLLENAAKGPEQWAQSMQVAQQYGIPLNGVPQQFDPEWASSQAQTLKLLQTPEGQEALSSAGKQAVDMGFQPGTPEFQAKVTELWQQSGAIPYTDSTGATRLYIPGRNGQPTQQAITEGTVVANDAGERMIYRGGKWEPMNAGGAGSNASGGFPAF